MAAAVYLARQQLSFALIAETVGGQANWSADVENYLGFHLLDGVELIKRFRVHLKDYESLFTLKEGESVIRVEKNEKGFVAYTDATSYQGKTLLIATGSHHRELNVPGEKALYGRGVTYCATCDAPLYRDKIVCVVGGGNSAMDAALSLEKYARRVFIVTVNAELKGDEVMRKKVLASQKISVYPLTKVMEIVGERQVTGVHLQDVTPSTTASDRVEMADGVCVEIGLVPSSQVIDFVAKDKRGQIIVDKNNATNIVGAWAAGDVTDITQKQIAIAVGEGAKAALSIIHHFQTS